MSKCIACGASWTTSGLALCPICGVKVGAAGEAVRPELSGVRATAGSGPPSPRLHRGTTVRMPSESSTPPPRPAALTPPVSKVVEDKASVARAAADKPSTENASEEKSPSARVAVEKPPPSKPAEPKSESVDRPADRPKESRPEPPLRVSTRLIDSSVKVLPAEMTTVPVPEHPMNGPLILGALALVTGLLLPLTLVFQGNRVVGVLGFCMSGFFLPFAPIAWIAGLFAERRRREQGLEPEPRVILGRLLGQWGTVLLIAEVTLVLILIAGLRLAGKLPPTFWVTAW